MKSIVSIRDNLIKREFTQKKERQVAWALIRFLYIFFTLQKFYGIFSSTISRLECVCWTPGLRNKLRDEIGDKNPIRWRWLRYRSSGLDRIFVMTMKVLYRLAYLRPPTQTPPERAHCVGTCDLAMIDLNFKIFSTECSAKKTTLRIVEQWEFANPWYPHCFVCKNL